MIGIVDYNAGNIRSVQRAFDFLKIEYLLSKNPIELQKVDRIFFPGVGEASYAMTQLKKTGFDIFLRDWAQAEKPLLGICLGSQIIFDHSEEGDVECLGLVPGKIRHFNSVLPDKHGLKIPHMGWNNLNMHKNDKLFDHVPPESDFYFVHSYLIQPQDPEVVTASTMYGLAVPAVVTYKNIRVVQFHPEKSGKPGLQLLQNFCKNDL